MSVYAQNNPSRIRLRDTNIDPVHGQNPDYYAETSSANGRNRPLPFRSPSGAKMSANNEQNYRANSSASRRPESDFYEREEMHLEPYPGSPHGPRSVPPTSDNAMQHRGRRQSRRDSFSSSSTISLSPPRYRDGSHDQSRGISPMSRARDIVSDNFSHTPAGIGAGIIGAVVGGIIANQASNAASKRKHKTNPYSRRSKSDDRTRMLSTLAGAVVGGLGANAVANRVQHQHGRKVREDMWPGRGGNFREESYESYSRSRSGASSRSGRRSRDFDDDEKRSHYLRAESEKGGRRRDEDEYDFVSDVRRKDDGQR